MTYQTYSSESIVIKHPELINTQYHGEIGNSDVLAKLLPRLLNTGILRSKPCSPLEGVDDYMMKELNELCRRLSRYYQHSGMDTDNEISVSMKPGEIEVIRQPGHGELSSLICADKWLKGAVEWLQPNFVGLVHSIELLAFSELYQQSVCQAEASFRHFEQEDYGLNFIVTWKHSKAHVTVESPVHTYIIT